jgi:uncharacterized membrane protein
MFLVRESRPNLSNALIWLAVVGFLAVVAFLFLLSFAFQLAVYFPFDGYDMILTITMAHAFRST